MTFGNESSAGGNRSGRVLAWSALIASLGSFLFGFDTAVISGTTGTLRQVFSLSDQSLGFTVSSALIGTIVGSLIIGKPCERLGRRVCLQGLALLFIIASIGCALAPDWWALVFFRWVGGVAVGGSSVVCPMYITEISPANRRGILVCVSQLNIVLGILAAYFSNWGVISLLGDAHPDTWRWMFGVMLIPSVVFFASILMIPESPRWLVHQNRGNEALKILSRLGSENPEQELRLIEESLLEAHSRPGLNLLWTVRYRRPLLLALMIAVFNQLDGINAVIYYTADIFRMAGATQTSAIWQSVLVGLTNLVLTLVGMALIDRIGRKALLLMGSVTFILSHSLAAWAFYTHAQGAIMLVALIGIVGSHAYSQGAVVWVCINELLPNAIRSLGAGLICFMMWTLCVMVTWLFPVIARTSGASAFAFFAVMMVIQFFSVWFLLPETKGITLEELEKKLGQTQ